jgi:cytochrome c5
LVLICIEFFNKLIIIKMKKAIQLTAFIAVAVITIIGFNSCDSNTYEEISQISNPTYEANIKSIFSSKCTSCHSSSGTQQLPYLTTYLEVKDGIENGVVLCLIDNPGDCFYSNIMPPEGRMPQTTIDLIKLWQTNGFINQ